MIHPPEEEANIEEIKYADTRPIKRRIADNLAGSLQIWLLGALALVVLLTYVGSTAANGTGYPLDDSWIHQTYARNFAVNGRWEYVPGSISAGSTAPLWTILLSAGYFLRIPHTVWTFFLGWICLTWTGWASSRLWSTLWPARANLSWIAGVVLVLSWPLVWAAGSGMETLLFIALEIEVIYLYLLYKGSRRFSSILPGLAVGLLILTRPEGLVLAILISLGLITAQEKWVSRLKNLALFVGGAAVLLLPYFAFNIWSSGTIWPNTFYAKQTEYAPVFTRPLIQRFLQLFYFSVGGAAEGWQGISGAHLLLLPGIIAAGIRSIRRDLHQRRLFASLPLFWALALVSLYAWRLPVTYQHGRYLFPALPFWILYGSAGWMSIWEAVAQWSLVRSRLQYVLGRAGSLTFAVLLVLFLFFGMQVYRQDVAFVNGEMVDVSLWLEDNTPPSATIAAHDIGAIGYFSERRILDLAGLISPEIISLLPDEQALADYVIDSLADYLVTAPGWTYSSVTSREDVQLEYTTAYSWTVEQGVNNMEVYRLK